MANSGEKKRQHMIPQTYMKQWSSNGKKVYVLDKQNDSCKLKEIKRLFYDDYKYSFIAGDPDLAEKSSDIIFAPLKNHKVFFNGENLKTGNDYSQNYEDFDCWEIYNDRGECLSKKEQSDIAKEIENLHDCFIEELWSHDFESQMRGFFNSIIRKMELQLQNQGEPPSEEEYKRLMEYFNMFRWRLPGGFKELNEVINNFIKETPYVEYGSSSHLHRYKNSHEMIRSWIYKKSFKEYFNGQGLMKETEIIYTSNLTFKFLYDDLGRFVSSDKPCYETEIDGCIQYVFITSPVMIVSLVRKDESEPDAYLFDIADKNTVTTYNKKTYESGKYILSRYKINKDDFI